MQLLTEDAAGEPPAGAGSTQVSGALSLSVAPSASDT